MKYNYIKITLNYLYFIIIIQKKVKELQDELDKLKSGKALFNMEEESDEEGKFNIKIKLIFYFIIYLYR